MASRHPSKTIAISTRPLIALQLVLSTRCHGSHLLFPVKMTGPQVNTRHGWIRNLRSGTETQMPCFAILSRTLHLPTSSIMSLTMSTTMGNTVSVILCLVIGLGNKQLVFLSLQYHSLLISVSRISLQRTKKHMAPSSSHSFLEVIRQPFLSQLEIMNFGHFICLLEISIIAFAERIAVV